MASWRIGPAGGALAGAAALAAYAVMSHLLMAYAPERPWSVALLFGPLLGAIALGGWARRHGPTLFGCAFAALGLATVVMRGGAGEVNRLYVLQHAAIHAALAWTFAITLRPGATALITRLAESIHDEFTPAMRRYTRALTKLWVLYFLCMIVVSLVVYRFAPWPWWSLFGNLVTPLAAAAFFAGEYLLRYRRHPEFERATLAQAVQAYRAASGR